MPKPSKFVKLFGVKPIIAGVYPTDNESSNSSSNRMLDEIALLEEHGISGVYLENVHNTESDMVAIEEVLKKLNGSNLEIRVGVNILPNHKGTEHVTAFRLAQDYNLPFVALDMIAGAYKIKTDVMELDGKSYFEIRKDQPRVVVIGGINPPYATVVKWKKLKSDIRVASQRSDAIMVKVRPEELDVPLERIAQYALYAGGVPLVIASRLTKDNIRKYVNIADGFIIGSGLREFNTTTGKLSVQAIKDIYDIVIEEQFNMLAHPKAH